MWRRSNGLVRWLAVAGLVAGCSGDQADESTTVALTEAPELVTVPDVSMVEPSRDTRVPATSTPEPAAPPLGATVDEATDPFGLRARRPFLAADPIEQWTVTLDRSTFPSVDAVADVIVLHKVTPGDDHSLVALDRTDGSIIWTYDPDEAIQLFVVGGAILTELRSPSGSTWAVVDPATGTAEPFVAGDAIMSVTDRHLAFYSNTECRMSFYDVVDRSLVSEFCLEGIGTATFTARVEGGIVEMSPVDLTTDSSVIPISSDLLSRANVSVVAGAVVATSSSDVSVLARDGSEIWSATGLFEPRVQPVGAGSSTLVVYDFERSESFGVDVATLEKLWTRPGMVDVFGIIDGVAIGLASGESQTEVVDLDTGSTMCSLDDGVRLAENGLYSFDGVVYGLDCIERWSVDRGDDGEFYMVDGGVLVAERIDDASLRLTFSA